MASRGGRESETRALRRGMGGKRIMFLFKPFSQGMKDDWPQLDPRNLIGARADSLTNLYITTKVDEIFKTISLENHQKVESANLSIFSVF